MKRRVILSIALAMLLGSSLRAADNAVKVWEEKVTIPTYLIGPPDPNPQFYFGGASQGAEHRIYPYPLYDNLLNEKVDKTYNMVYLENEYIKVGILPEIGGKIFEAIDKTNGYNFFYHQHVIKPALISLLGAWISGGVEWDVPHHHRATSFLPVQYKIEENSDGSKTVWVGELELRDRMRWAVGTTLHPGKSYLECAFRMINRTPVPTSMLCFSNVAVHVDDTYQVIFPPSTQHVTYHAKRDFTTWPIATTRFNGADFTAGVDVSWYKSHINSNSMFAWNYQDDFFAGYNHGKHAGTMSIADHNFVPGKKFWTWGTGPRGKAQDWLLTDSDGPYIELMVGAYSDNQPDYTWLAPYETRTWTQYWYPFRDIDGVKFANTEAAVNLDVKDGKGTVGFYTTAAYQQARMLVTHKGTAIVAQQADINPGKPFVQEFIVPAGADEHDLRASISVNGRELAAYSPVRLSPEPMPQPYNPPPSPDQIKTSEELYLAGLRIDAFHNPQLEPEPYWEEALKRDPGDSRNNVALAINYYKIARYADAEKLLRAAIERITFNYTTPKDGEPFYYLGLVLKAQGKLDEADVNFQKSTWSAAWRSPGYFESAQIASTRGEFNKALALVDRSLQANTMNIRGLTLRAAVLRHLDRNDEAAEVLARAGKQVDPLDARILAERALLSRSAEDWAPMTQAMTDFPALALETAAEYMNAGLWQDGHAVLSQVFSNAKDRTAVNPMILYYLGYFTPRLNREGGSPAYTELASRMPPNYVFPFQREMIDVLEAAMKANPTDSRAPYYLGNLLYDGQPQRAAELWEKSATLGADFPVVYRNLASYYTRQGDARAKALAALEKAARLGGNAMVFRDLDQLYQEDKIFPDKRLAMIKQHQKVIDRDDIIAREIDLKIFAGKSDEAVQLLNGRFFRVWEGGGRFNVGDSWVNAMLLRGQQKLSQASMFKEALADFQAAQQVPPNLSEYAGGADQRKSEIAYWTGVAYAGMGDMEKAKQSWTEASAAEQTQPAGRGGRGFGRGGGGGFGRGPAQVPGARVAEASTYFQAMALMKLGQTDKATPMFQQLIASGAEMTSRPADGHYLAGLGYLGQKQNDKAKEEFTQALAASPDHLAAKIAMNWIKD